MPRQPPYWFPAKRYGWGWGPPTTWQGWVVVGGFFAAQLRLALVLLPRSPARFALASLGLAAVLIVICWLKGEPPAWRWGNRDD